MKKTQAVLVDEVKTEESNIQQFEKLKLSMIIQDFIAATHKINRSLDSKWCKEREKIFKCATSEYHKNLKIRPATKYLELYRVLRNEFQDARSKRHRVYFG